MQGARPSEGAGVARRACRRRCKDESRGRLAWEGEGNAQAGRGADVAMPRGEANPSGGVAPAGRTTRIRAPDDAVPSAPASRGVARLGRPMRRAEARPSGSAKRRRGGAPRLRWARGTRRAPAALRWREGCATVPRPKGAGSGTPTRGLRGAHPLRRRRESEKGNRPRFACDGRRCEHRQRFAGVRILMGPARPKGALY